MPVMLAHQAERLKKMIALYGRLEPGDIQTDFQTFLYEYIDTVTTTPEELSSVAELLEKN